MLKITQFSFTIPICVMLGFVMLLCLTVLCSCGSPGNSQKPPDSRIVDNTPVSEIDFNNTELGKRIRKDYFDFLQPVRNQVSVENFQVESLWIRQNLGVFSGFTVVLFDQVFVFPGRWTPTKIGAACLNYSTAFHIIAWRDGEIFTFFSAVENNILSEADVQEIWSIITVGHAEQSECN